VRPHVAKIKHAVIAREIELCECQFVTIVIDIVHNSAISVRRKGLIGSMEYFRLISADSTLSFCFSTSVTMNGILTPARARERERCSSPATRFSSCLHFARASRASVQAVFRAQNETSIPHSNAYYGSNPSMSNIS
jgi:hypothetical protein